MSILQIEEHAKLTNIIAGLYDITDGGARGRRVFMQAAGLDRFLLGMDLTGASRTIAGDLIGRLEKFGQPALVSKQSNCCRKSKEFWARQLPGSLTLE